MFRFSAFCKPCNVILKTKNSNFSLNVSLFRATSSVVPLTCNFPEASKFDGVKSYTDLHRFSVTNTDKFWGTLAESRLQWIEPFQTVSDCDFSEGKISWFLNGKLNVSVNCVDRHAAATPHKTALIWEKDEPGEVEHVTYTQLLDMVLRFANCLRRHGVKKGDRVAIYMPVSPIAVAAMLACARIGAVHTVVFAGFSAESLSQRILDAGVETVLTTDQAVRGGKAIPLKKTVDKAVASCPSVKRVFVSKRTGADVSKTDLDIDLDSEMEKSEAYAPPEVMDSEDMLFLLYTSGSTGQPKGIVHTHAGYLLYAMLTHQLVFSYEENDVFGCVADIGWITGHSYVVYGPLANGATTVLFESVPTYPDPGRYWDMVERHKINQLYVAPTAVRQLLRYDDSFVSKHDLSSLRVLGSVGEPINHEAWNWLNDVIGQNKCDVVDTWWQTETGGIAISPRPAAADSKIYPAACMNPFFGIDVALVDKNSKKIDKVEQSGACCIASPWPGMARTVYGSHERFLDTYFRPYPGYYFSGDGAVLRKEGYYQITGRVDDVLNISGHRVGAAEIENAITDHAKVSEAAVVGIPHRIKGEVAFAFVTTKQGADFVHDELVAELQGIVKQKIASFAIPQSLVITDALPKTRSGKIMRRILRKIAVGDVSDLGDTSTLADPDVINKLLAKW